jgi:hypothetical protein
MAHSRLTQIVRSVYVFASLLVLSDLQSAEPQAAWPLKSRQELPLPVILDLRSTIGKARYSTLWSGAKLSGDDYGIIFWAALLLGCGNEKRLNTTPIIKGGLHNEVCHLFYARRFRVLVFRQYCFGNRWSNGAIACFSSNLIPSRLNADRAPQLKAVVGQLSL